MFSAIGQNLMQRTGIDDLMEDLYKAVHSGNPNLCQLNGGSPAFFPEVNAMWHKSLEDLVARGEFDSVVGLYAHPRGDKRFIDALVRFLNDRYNWGLTEHNVAITQGGQMAFFLLFNLLGGPSSDGEGMREILFPLCPDYIGYQPQSLFGNAIFRGTRPTIMCEGKHSFKYGIDFSRLDITPRTAALCLSRPTNPTGNVVTDEELAQLHERARKAGIPLMIDNAYGPPLPNICFTKATPIWDENVVLSMSLSKIGLPGTRTGIVIAKEEIIDALVRTVTTSALCPNNFGQKLITPYIEDGSIETVCRELITPYYKSRAQLATDILHEVMPDELPWRVHRSEGAMFLWLWMEGLPITAQELYERCRERGCFINPGHHFFFALDQDEYNSWRHTQECVRLSFTQPDDILRRGLSILAEEVVKAYREAGITF
jgi:valine--pyruvate aminotransferase